MNDIDITIDTQHAVDIALVWFGYKLIGLFVIVAGFIALGFAVWYFVTHFAGGFNNIRLPKAPTEND